MAYTENKKTLVFNSIIDKIEEGKPVRVILKEQDMPSTQTFFKWLNEDSEKAKLYACACEVRADKIFEDIIFIADATEDDIITDINGNLVTNHNVIQRDRLRVDARKWIASKLNPKKYGDKIDMTTNGKEITSVTRTIIDESTNQDS